MKNWVLEQKIWIRKKIKAIFDLQKSSFTLTKSVFVFIYFELWHQFFSFQFQAVVFRFFKTFGPDLARYLIAFLGLVLVLFLDRLTSLSVFTLNCTKVHLQRAETAVFMRRRFHSFDIIFQMNFEKQKNLRERKVLAWTRQDSVKALLSVNANQISKWSKTA